MASKCVSSVRCVSRHGPDARNDVAEDGLGVDQVRDGASRNAW